MISQTETETRGRLLWKKVSEMGKVLMERYGVREEKLWFVNFFSRERNYDSTEAYGSVNSVPVGSVI